MIWVPVILWAPGFNWRVWFMHKLIRIQWQATWLQSHTTGVCNQSAGVCHQTADTARKQGSWWCSVLVDMRIPWTTSVIRCEIIFFAVRAVCEKIMFLLLTHQQCNIDQITTWFLRQNNRLFNESLYMNVSLSMFYHVETTTTPKTPTFVYCPKTVDQCSSDLFHDPIWFCRLLCNLWHNLPFLLPAYCVLYSLAYIV